MALSLSKLTTELLELKGLCKCSKIRIIEIDDVEIDATKRNTIQILSNGEVWFIACDGQTVLLGGTGDPVTLNADQPTQDSANLVGQELQFTPATSTTYGVVRLSDVIPTVVANFAALPDPTTVSGKFYWAEASQGTKFIGVLWGGSYYPVGMYYSNGVAWIYMDTPAQATQAEVDAGVVTNKFVTPETLATATTVSHAADIANIKKTSIGFTAFGTLTTGKVNGFFTCPYVGTITGWNIVVDAGTATIKIWKIATGTAKPTIADVINTAGVSISSGTAVHSTDVTDFTTTAVAANDIFAFDLTTVSGVAECTFQIEITKT